MYLYSRCVNGQVFAMNLTLNLETWFKVSVLCTSFTQRHSVGEV